MKDGNTQGAFDRKEFQRFDLPYFLTGLYVLRGIILPLLRFFEPRFLKHVTKKLRITFSWCFRKQYKHKFIENEFLKDYDPDIVFLSS